MGEKSRWNSLNGWLKEYSELTPGLNKRLQNRQRVFHRGNLTFKKNDEKVTYRLNL